jgi:ribosomal protein S5
MSFPVTVTFRDIDISPSVEHFARTWAARLGRVDSQIVRCDVTIERPHKHHERGNLFRVRVVVAVPGNDIIVSHDPGENGAHDDVRVAVRDSFRAARRQLEEFARRQRSHSVALEPARG